MNKNFNIDEFQDRRLFHELKDDTANLINDHYNKAKSWMPIDLIPFENHQNYNPKDEWDQSIYPLCEGVRSSLFVNLLTEDNLPYYTNTIKAISAKDHPFNEWINRWTAEEARHSEVIRGWVHASGALDPRMLESARMAQMTKAEVPEYDSFSEIIVYTSLQELATKVAHSNTGKFLKELGGDKVMARVAGDEVLHHSFYSNLAKVAFEINPELMLLATANVITSFKMPGTGIENFNQHAKAIAKEGIYDFSKFLKLVIEPTLDKWSYKEITIETEVSENAIIKINKHLNTLQKISRRNNR